MPPKSRKVQLAAARKNKALKNAINETLLNDDELLSDCYNSDDDWHDVELENNLDQISQTVFDVMIENAKKPTAFRNSRPLVYVGTQKGHRNVKNLLRKLQQLVFPNLMIFSLIRKNCS